MSISPGSRRPRGSRIPTATFWRSSVRREPCRLARMNTPPEVVAYYDRFPEETRLELGPSRLERARTQEILLRVLPPPPARIVDVGGAAGAYSSWLAGLGYEVHLVDASPRLIDVARTQNPALDKPIAS